MDTLSSVASLVPDNNTTKSSQGVTQVLDDIIMREASQSPIQLSSGSDATTNINPSLIPYTEAASITSNAVIAGLNKQPIPPSTTEASSLNSHVGNLPNGLTLAQPPHQPTPAQASQSNINTWAEKIQNSTDRKLKNHASPSLSPDGIPRVKIPDSVFQRGADAHKDFVLGVFLGKTPYFGHIQSVLTHIWGRGLKLEIHLRPASRSMLVRIPNSTIRNKIVEQEIWHIGSSLFYVAQWSSNIAINPPSFTSIPLWAHVRGIPLTFILRKV